MFWNPALSASARSCRTIWAWAAALMVVQEHRAKCAVVSAESVRVAMLKRFVDVFELSVALDDAVVLAAMALHVAHERTPCGAWGV